VPALSDTGGSSDEADPRIENAEGPKEGESGGVGRVAAKRVLSIRASASKSISGVLRGLTLLAVCGCFKSSSVTLAIGWSVRARNSEDFVLDDRDSCGRWIFSKVGPPGIVDGCQKEEPDCGPIYEVADLANSGESMGKGLCGGSDAGVRGTQDSLLGKSIVVTGASTLTRVGAW